MLIESVYSVQMSASIYIVCFYLDHCQMEVYPKDWAAVLSSMRTLFYYLCPESYFDISFGE